MRRDIIEDEVRSGIVGAWDRFAGPGQSRIELAGTVAAVAAATVGGVTDHRIPRHSRWLARLTAIDLWGGAWVNNTPSCVRWYERPGQGVAEHVRFAALHLAHPALLSYADVTGGHRSVGSAARWTFAHYAWMLVSSTAISMAPRRGRLPMALAASVAGLGIDRVLGRSRVAPWFAPVFYTKLLVGHAAGSIWNRSRNEASPCRR